MGTMGKDEGKEGQMEGQCKRSPSSIKECTVVSRGTGREASSVLVGTGSERR